MRRHGIRNGRVLFALCAVVLLASCQSSPRPTAGVRGYASEELSGQAGWSQHDLRGVMVAFLRSCTRFKAVPATRSIGSGALARPASAWQARCAEAERIDAEDRSEVRSFFEDRFQAVTYRASGSTAGKITGYYEPELTGSQIRRGRYQYPLYRKPPSAKRGKRLPSRKAIEAGAFAGRGLELVWVDDDIDLFFLHIQGSGRILFENGTTMRVGYGGQNGHRYVPIGRVLAKRGHLEQDGISMQSIKTWLRLHPEQADAIMNTNPSYIFFRRVEGEGPIGAQGVALTPLRSIAVDPAHVPLGAPVWVDTTDPVVPARPLRFLAVAQDTGGAIKGLNRADIFWGTGLAAGERAGRMNRPGRLVILLPNTR